MSFGQVLGTLLILYFMLGSIVIALPESQNDPYHEKALYQNKQYLSISADVCAATAAAWMVAPFLVPVGFWMATLLVLTGAFFAFFAYRFHKMVSAVK